MTKKPPPEFAGVRSFSTPPTWCPVCRTSIDAATGVTVGTRQPDAPEPGDITLCFYCGAWLVFSETLSLRVATEDEIAQTDARARDLVARATAKHKPPAH